MGPFAYVHRHRIILTCALKCHWLHTYIFSRHAFVLPKLNITEQTNVGRVPPRLEPTCNKVVLHLQIPVTCPYSLQLVRIVTQFYNCLLKVGK